MQSFTILLLIASSVMSTLTDNEDLAEVRNNAFDDREYERNNFINIDDYDDYQKYKSSKKYYNENKYDKQRNVYDQKEDRYDKRRDSFDVRKDPQRYDHRGDRYDHRSQSHHKSGESYHKNHHQEEYMPNSFDQHFDNLKPSGKYQQKHYERESRHYSDNNNYKSDDGFDQFKKHKQGKKHKNHEKYSNNFDDSKEYKKHKYPKESYNDKGKEFFEKNEESRSEPPDHRKLIAMARYVIHNADWASIATISTTPAIKGFPFSNVKSMVDGSIANSTGIPYFYISPLDFTARDLAKNPQCTVLATLEETSFCHDKQYDPEDPRCTRVMLSGQMRKVKEDTAEFEFAKAALFERHPAMANFPPDHDFFVAKLKIALIAMVDWFGGAKYIPVKDYLAYNYTQSDLLKFTQFDAKIETNQI